MSINFYYSKCLVPPKLDRAPLISVVIACPKTSWMLDECLDALRGQSYANWEAIVLPDAAEGGRTADAGRVRFLPTGKVRPAEKRNLGIRAAKGEIVACIDKCYASKNGKPKCLYAHTVKGKGVSFMENQCGWHGVAPNDEQYAQAMAELKAQLID